MLRQFAYGAALAAGFMAAGVAGAETCGPEALGTHRTLKVSAADGPVPTYLDLMRVTTETIAAGLAP